MANVDTFPLLKLPYLPLANVIHQFDSIYKRVYLATLSRRTAILVKSLRDIKVLGLNLIVSSDLKLEILRLDYNRIIRQEWTFQRNLYKPKFLFLVDYNRMKKLIDTMFFIFSLSGIEEIVVKREENGKLEMSRLQNRLWNLNTIKFERIYSSEFYDQVLAAFPSVKNVCMTGKPNNQVLTKKLEILKFSTPNLCNLSMVNCESLQLPTSASFWIELNQFMKSWIHGSMSRLKHVHIQKLLPMHQNLILDGIECREADHNREKTFKSYSLKLWDPKTTVVRGGLNIESKNGARATITTQNKGNGYLLWNMNVWD